MQEIALRLRHGLAAFAVLAAVAMIVAITVARGASGADHRDSPGVEDDAQGDITDVYAFRSPENDDNLVIALGVNGLTAPADNASATFGDDVTYTIHVDGDGDLQDDATVNVDFDGDTYTVTGLGDPITGDVTAGNTATTAPDPIVNETGGIKSFAGQRDDAFFFDLVGFQNFIAGPYVPAAGLRDADGGTPADTFAGTNTSYFVLELPITAVTGATTSDTGVIKAWASTSRGGSQVDRMAIPAINTALIPGDQKDTFNKAVPANDEDDFRQTGQDTIDTLRGAVDGVLDEPVGPQDGGPLGDLDSATVAAALIPDIVTIDFSQPVVFPNGRQLTDDVIDVALQLVLNRTAGVTDAIDANDKAFSDTFPYLAAPHQPEQAPGDLPSTGAQTADDESGDETLLAIILAGGAALALIGGGLVLSRRNNR